MEVLIALITGILGAATGAAVALKIAMQRQAQTDKAAEPVRMIISSNEIEQQQEALNRMRESNLSLTTRLHELSQQHEKTVESLRKDHAMERAGFEEELRRLKEQLTRIASAMQGGSAITPNSFAPTQFDPEEQTAQR